MTQLGYRIHGTGFKGGDLKGTRGGGAWALQVVGSLGDVPPIFSGGDKAQSPILLPRVVSAPGAPFPLPTFSGSSQRLWEGCLGGGFFNKKEFKGDSSTRRQHLTHDVLVRASSQLVLSLYVTTPGFREVSSMKSA